MCRNLLIWFCPYFSYLEQNGSKLVEKEMGLENKNKKANEKNDWLTHREYKFENQWKKSEGDHWFIVKRRV